MHRQCGQTGCRKKEKNKRKNKNNYCIQKKRELYNNNNTLLRTRLLSQFCTVDYISTYNTQLSACRGYALPMRTNWIQKKKGEKEEEEKKKKKRKKKASRRREGVT